MQPTLRLIPLGGYGEIGKNMTVLESDGKLLVIDAGVAFPDENTQLGIDLLIPNYAFLRDNRERLAGIFLTHGHEDHIGGLPYLLRDLQAAPWGAVPVYGTPLTLGFLRAKLGGKVVDECDLHQVAAGDRVDVGPFNVECIHVNHSIPDSLALAVRTSAGTVFHSGDFKFDHTPIDGRVTDFAALARLGEEGVKLMLSDSTYVNRPGHTPSEATVGKAFERLFPRVRGRLIVATFASQIHRIQQVFDAAEKMGKRVLVSGRSMERNVNVARELGHLHYTDHQRITYGDLPHVPDEDVIILITGSQGEPVSGLTRMAKGSHPKLRIHEGDTVVISATAIPGNEATIWRVINELLLRGAAVLTHRDDQVHVSGHASSEEIKLLFNLIRPEFAVPFHGEYRHMIAYGDLAQDVGMSHEHIFLLHNGDVLRIDRDGAALEAPVEHGVWSIDGKRVNEQGLSDSVLQDRGFLAESGVITASLAWDYDMGELLAPPLVGVRGVRCPERYTPETLLSGAVERISDRLGQLGPDQRVDPIEVERAAKRAVRGFFERATGTYPVLQVMVVGINEPGAVPVHADEFVEPETQRGAVLAVDGQMGRPCTLTLDDLAALRPESSEDDETISLSLRSLLDHAGLSPLATHLALYGGGDQLVASLPLTLLTDRAILVFGSDDQRLDSDEGGPVLWRLTGSIPPMLTDYETVPDVRRLTATIGPVS
ncbi:MAG: RNase J family beta-CASP ribonuclease [Armatimonadetes bacterium]|nr:RNase J family beta-CASP ribonuclease [Armatimonadota bacterium]